MKRDRSDFLALLQHFAWVIDAVGPAHVGNEHHAVDSFLRLHEGAVRGHVAHVPLTCLPIG